MIFALATFLSTKFGLNFDAARKYVSIGLVFAALALLFVLVLLFTKACDKPAKLNEQEIQAAQKAVEQRNDAQLKEILVQADVREKQIDTTVANASVQTRIAADESREKYANLNTSELAAELEKRR